MMLALDDGGGSGVGGGGDVGGGGGANIKFTALCGRALLGWQGRVRWARWGGVDWNG